jgi:hypothetical protein
MHKPETKIERDVRILCKNQVDENYCKGLDGEFVKPFVYL